MGSTVSDLPHKPPELLGQDAQYFKANFLLTDTNIFKLLEVFQSFDLKCQGYLTMDDFIDFIVEDNYTLLLPCIIHLFRLIAKQDTDKIYFQEWLGSMISFCLYNKEALFRFTFEMIDTDYDEKITHSDISYYLNFQDPKTGVKVFPISFISSFEQAKITSDKEIFFEEFKKMNENFKFLCWPAQNLQENLRSKLIDNVFWEKLNDRIEQEQSKLKKKMKEQKFKKLFEDNKRGERRWKRKLHVRKSEDVGNDMVLSFKNSQEGQIGGGNIRFRRKSLGDLREEAQYF